MGLGIDVGNRIGTIPSRMGIDVVEGRPGHHARGLHFCEHLGAQVGFRRHLPVRKPEGLDAIEPIIHAVGRELVDQPDVLGPQRQDHVIARPRHSDVRQVDIDE